MKTIEALEAENFTLAAGQCVVEDGLVGDEHGHFRCSLEAGARQLNDQDALIADLLGALKEARGQVVGFMLECGHSPDAAVANVARLDASIARATGAA